MSRLRPAALALLALGTLPCALRAQRDDDTQRDAFRWEGVVPRGRWLYVKNMNGSIHVDRAGGDRVTVTADKRVQGGADPREVRFVVQKADDGQGMVICALWGDDASCDERGYRSHHERWNDDRRGSTSVEFTVHLPAGVKVDVATVNGGLEVSGASSEVVARTTNGGVRAETDGGPVSARTTNGSVYARMSTVGDARDLDFATTNGSVTVEMPSSLGADVEMSTVNGRVETEFPVTLTGRIDPRHLRATVGDGSRRVRLRTVNGSVHLRRTGA